MTDNEIRVTLVDMSSSDFLFTQKPSGYNTHSPDIGKKGFVEVLSEKFHKELFVVHRLDKETSGAMIFATTKTAAAELSSLFEKHLIQKKYLFLTDRQSPSHVMEYESYIEKDKGVFKSSLERPANSKTRFEKLRQLGAWTLWQAIPFSGKPHQIRLHAEACGIPVLGDKDHNGTPFFRLCLHSQSLEFEYHGQKFSFSAEDPVWVKELERDPTTDLEELRILEAFQHRQWFFDFTQQPEECLRLSHQDIDSYRIDMYGDHLWVYWYKDIDPGEKDLARFARVAVRYQKKIFVRKMLNRGEEPNAQILWALEDGVNWNPKPQAKTWVACENTVKYELRTDSGLSPGLFLDQRENRKWVRDNAKDKKVLNLFSYTSGFSSNAALGGASEVVTVDVSANFIEWSKKNFELNVLKIETATENEPAKKKLSYKELMSDAQKATQFEFWVQDSLLFLKGTQRRQRKFDLIICDPPSFGRSKNSTFSISKNYEELLLNCFLCLNRGGKILFCTNYEKWTLLDIRKNLQRLKSQINFKFADAPSPGLDFELPDEEPLMKSLILVKS